LQGFEGLTWLEAGVKVAVHIMRQKIISGSRDEAAVLLYNAVRPCLACWAAPGL
jgi:hypothetical protein